MSAMAPTGNKFLDPQKLYDEGVNSYKSEQYEPAFKSFEKAALLGHVKARTDLANLYTQGHFVEIDRVFAVQLLAKSIKDGHKRARANLDFILKVHPSYRDLLEVNLKELMENARQQVCHGKNQEAFTLFKKAVLLGDAKAKPHVAYYYNEGEGGVEKDTELAKDLMPVLSLDLIEMKV